MSYEKYCECGKRCYTKKEAQTVVNTCKRPINKYSGHGVKVHITRWSKKKPIRVYNCPFCNYWHITSEIRHKDYKGDYKKHDRFKQIKGY